MDTKYPKIEKSNQIVWSLEVVSGQAKSYTCSFCKKGFSNAQALGGHMNIHRKDRAKLRQSSEENINILSSDIVKTTNSPADDHSQVSEIIVLESSEEKSSWGTPKTKRPTKLCRDQDDGASASGSSPRARDQLNLTKISGENNEDSSLLMIMSHGSSTTSQIELDLELRLGPEPHRNQPSSKNTKDFL